MKDYVIIVDATCDLGQNLQERFDIHVLPTYVILPDKSELHMGPVWENWSSSDEFYTELKKNPTGFTTSPANQRDFEQCFEHFASLGKDVLAISISTGLSGTFSNMKKAVENIKKDYPLTNFACIDSLRYSTALGLLVVQASINRSNGMSLEENVKFLEENKNSLHQAGWLDDLSFLAKKGRVNNAQAFFGTLAGIKPIGEFDSNGLTTVLTKAKGAKSAFKILLEYIERTIKNPEEQIIFIAQTNRLKFAEEYKKMIIERFHPKEVIINDVYPQCGISIGPGLMACYYFGTPISSDLSVEKKLLEELNK